MTPWRERLSSHTEFLKFGGAVLSLFKQAEDREQFAYQLARGNIGAALEEGQLSEREVAEQLHVIEEQGDRLLNDPEVNDAVDEYVEERESRRL